jgi:hypothetical protein
MIQPAALIFDGVVLPATPMLEFADAQQLRDSRFRADAWGGWSGGPSLPFQKHSLFFLQCGRNLMRG